MPNKKVFISLLLLLSITLSACGTKKVEELPAREAALVKGQKISDSLSIKRDLSYPGIVASESEAKIIAKTSGTVTGFNVKTGDAVTVSQELGKVDDVGGSRFNSNSFNANQVKQAQIAVAQAQSAYALAQTNYNNSLVSSVKDLRSAEIARDQAAKGQSNLNDTTAESLKSAELAYETAKIASEQAKLSLENRKKQASQNSSDVKDNADIAADSASGAVGTMISGVNNMLGLDDNGTVYVSYKTNLGALNSSSYQAAKAAYDNVKIKYATYTDQSFANSSDKLNAAITLAEEAKKMVDAAKYLLEKTISSSSLPQSSATGPSLSGLQQSVSAYQSQMNTILSSARAARQALANVDLNNDSLSDTLQKAYELAKQQEASAAQNLNNLKVGSSSQKDQAGFSSDLAQNQFENTKVKINSQIAASRSQMESAQLQYTNAQVNLQNLFDIHSLISPISGTLTRKLVNDGDTVSAGQLVAAVSQTDNLKVQFYIESERLTDITPGLVATVEANDGQTYTGIVSSVAQQADPVSRRFLAEINLDKKEGLVIGTVVNVKLSLNSSVVTGSNSIILPLSALNVGQNLTTIFINDNGVAKKSAVEVIEVMGEFAKIKTDLTPDVMVVIDGNKMLEEGQSIKFN
jgi:RND family efflux transporter MFP subunit